nr:fatty acid desaturase [Pseudenhygromyxa sp. WMMC2535]
MLALAAALLAVDSLGTGRAGAFGDALAELDARAAGFPGLKRTALAVLIAAQGCWLHRLYVVAHEASHRKLWPEDPRLNDILGQLLLLPLMLPLRIHRKIHAFHHGHNRRDHRTSALDTFVVRGRASAPRRAWCWLLWLVAVFGGGWFIHSLISVVLFLAMPLPVARRISPAFKGWRTTDQLRSLATFGLGVGLHLSVGLTLGARAWALTLGAPLLAFAWIYSVLVYIYHYDTDYGPDVRFHVRSLRPNRLASWWLLNFNEHATHHRAPKLTWYQLPEHREALPPEHQGNQKVDTILGAILLQLRGPKIIERAEEPAPGEQGR